MRVRVVGKDKQRCRELERMFTKAGFLLARDPDMMICLGGDGTYLFAERKFPHIPKLIIRDNSVAKKARYGWKDVPMILQKLKKSRFRVRPHFTLEARAGKDRLRGINEVTIRNRLPTNCIRFRLHINGRLLGKVFIGDGIIVATPFGSSGYHQSAGGNPLTQGIGLVFNNPTEPHRGQELRKDAVLHFLLIREEATLSVDNNPRIIRLRPGARVTITKSTDAASFVELL